MKLVLALFALSVPRFALAQAEPTECSTTTTVRCTGAAASLAVRRNLDDEEPPLAPRAPLPPSEAPPPVVPPPAVVVPPVVLPSVGITQPTLVTPLAPPPQVVIVPQRDVMQVLPDGSRLVLTPNGWWRERDVSRSIRGAWITGLVLLLTHYTFAFCATPSEGLAYLPVVGPFVLAAQGGGSGLWIYDGVTQLAGLVLVIVGAAARTHRIERTQVTAGPIVWPTGNGIAGRF